jgi:hypothetical protein
VNKNEEQNKRLTQLWAAHKEVLADNCFATK